jgi:hypothetical protein
MRAVTRAGFTVLSAVSLVLTVEAVAATVRRMTLDDLCRSSGRIFRGTVVEIEEGTVEVGGGLLPTRTFSIRVDERFKGDFPTEKDVPIVEMRTVGKSGPIEHGDARWQRVLPAPPALVVGESYLLFVTAPSAIGLSTTVGLGQGCFHVTPGAEREEAVNGFDNVGLLPAARRADVAPQGPISYARLAAEVRAIVQGS